MSRYNYNKENINRKELNVLYEDNNSTIYRDKIENISKYEGMEKVSISLSKNDIRKPNFNLIYKRILEKFDGIEGAIELLDSVLSNSIKELDSLNYKKFTTQLSDYIKRDIKRSLKTLKINFKQAGISSNVDTLYNVYNILLRFQEDFYYGSI